MLLKGLLNKNERQIIWRKLHLIDLQLLHCAICSTREILVIPEFIEYVMENGYVELLQFLDPCKLYYVYARIVAFNGHLDVLKWMLDINRNNPYNILHHAFRGAIHSNRFDILKYIKQAGFDIYRLYDCIRYGSLQIIQWYVSNGAIFKDGHIFYTIAHDKLDIFVWFIESGYYIDLQKCRKMGNKKIKKWIDQRV